MPRLTLRTLLAYIDDTLGPVETRSLGRKVADSDEARDLVERIKVVTRRRGLKSPTPANSDDETADPNTVAEYLDNTLDSDTLKQVEETCLASDVHLAEVAACHQILTLVLTEPVRVPPQAHQKMYKLVPPPASVPDRRPSKTLPIGGARPPEWAKADADDADAALLLGMRRYSAANTWASRLALFGAAAIFLLFLAIAVYMALPHPGPKPPETTPGHSFAQLPAGVPDPTPKPKEPNPVPPKKPDPVVPKPKAVEVDVFTALAGAVAGEVAATKPIDPGPGLGDPVAAPDPAVRDIGRVETNRVLVVTQPPDAGGVWFRLRLKADDDEIVFANVPVMALPGYKANLLVGERDKQVQVHLWGNIPEQLPYRVFESRVVFHPPASGFDADITLQAGRIYLKSKKLGADKKPTGAKVRMRVASEVWDITLKDEKADVLVELISWFAPGTAYASVEGSQPKREGRVAVVAGAADVAAPARFKKFDAVAVNSQITWDSGSGALSEPKAIENMQESAQNPTLDGESQKIVARVLTGAADEVTARNVTRRVMEARLDLPPGTPDRDFIARLAVYSQAALADSTPTGGDMLKPLVDVLKSELPWLARQSAVTALTAWVARDRGNTAILRGVLINKELSENDADILLRLLRGFVSPTKPDPDRLDELAKLLESPAIPVREAALWNIAAADLESWVPLAVFTNVGSLGGPNSPEFKKFLTDWRARVEAVKKRPAAVPAPIPLPVPKK